MKVLGVNDTPRRLGLDDLPLCIELATDRKWAPEVEKWRLLLSVGECWGIDHIDKKLAAAAVLMRYDTALAVVGVLLVRHDFAGHGLGRYLAEFVLERAKGAHIYLHAFEMGQPLYEKLGFHTVDHLSTFTGHFITQKEDKNMGQSSQPGHIDKIIEFDREVSGADRSRLLCDLSSIADRVRIIEKAGQIIGYGLAWAALEVMHVGPLVATDDDTAALLVSDLASDQPLPILLDLYASHNKVFNWLQKRGLGEQRSVPMMVLGKQPLPGKRSQVYTVAMPVTG